MSATGITEPTPDIRQTPPRLGVVGRITNRATDVALNLLSLLPARNNWYDLDSSVDGAIARQSASQRPSKKEKRFDRMISSGSDAAAIAGATAITLAAITHGEPIGDTSHYDIQ